ncbi:MAG: ATP-binding cassette domain-containing protein [Acidobacteriota bacterium]
MDNVLLELKNVSVNYGRKAAVKNLSARFNPGETVLIAGRNGAGKSTLLKTLGQLIRPDSGSIDYKGVTRESMGLITDKMSLFQELSLEEGIRFHCETFGIDKFNSEILDHLGIGKKEKISTLSSGERALYHLSLLIAQKPELLLIDEVFHLADPYIRDVFIESLISLIDETGTSLVMINHTFSETGKIPERVIIMDEGEIIIDEKRDLLLGKVKKVSTEMPEQLDLPVFFSRNTPFGSESFIYPYEEGMKISKNHYIEDIGLDEIIKAFLGGRYAEKRI